MAPSAILLSLWAIFGLVASTCKATDYVLYSDRSRFHPGQSLSYDMTRHGIPGPASLVMQSCCNLVLSRTDTGKVLWQSHKFSDSHDCVVTLDGNGELFVKHGNREILWRSETRSKNYGIYALALRKDARLVIYGPQVWNTKPFW
ncbi:hypothetical protein J5N97_013575 [Dioscorea zingiberensis]|uniref:Bulb-type lectin domain-containing protein n=1 Tax=Dioscorea zingiberensis TaxID=325984 RepID=A0A9D5CR17_9LILI|nr:hypothetical protein J5N97_013575 [Dioscorea zingiberensis]